MRPKDTLNYQDDKMDALCYLSFANDLLGIRAAEEIFYGYPEVYANAKCYSSNDDMPPEAREVLERKEWYDDTILGTFINRYNKRLLHTPFDYDDYLADKEIQRLIRELHFDVVGYWYLLLFIYDYSHSICVNGKKTIDTPCNQLKKLTDIIMNNAESFNWAYGIKMKKEITLIVQVEGEKKKLVIDNPDAIGYLCHSIMKVSDEEKIRDKFIMTQRKTVNTSTTLPNSSIIYYFADLLLRFMRSSRTVSQESEKKVKHTKKELELASRLVYFTKISKNKKFCDIESDTLKGYLSRKKEINEESNIYPSLEG